MGGSTVSGRLSASRKPLSQRRCGRLKARVRAARVSSVAMRPVSSSAACSTTPRKQTSSMGTASPSAMSSSLKMPYLKLMGRPVSRLRSAKAGVALRRSNTAMDRPSYHGRMEVSISPVFRETKPPDSAMPVSDTAVTSDSPRSPDSSCRRDSRRLSLGKQA